MSFRGVLTLYCLLQVNYLSFFTVKHFSNTNLASFIKLTSLPTDRYYILILFFTQMES